MSNVKGHMLNVSQHVSVLLQESIDGLSLSKGELLLDCTFGAGGHSSYACSKGIRVIALDQDENALKNAEQISKEEKCDITVLHYNFKDLDKALLEADVRQADGILFDLGTSVDQIKTSGRGFTFEKEEPLLMTLNTQDGVLTAKDIVNVWGAETLEIILKNYGEERFARRIAQGIVEAREQKPIETTTELVEIVKNSTPKFYHFKRINPATKTFQALRIATNDEMTALRTALRKSFEKVKAGGRIAVISFHSLEDREVKHYFRELEKEDKGKRITKKPMSASDQEVQENPRSRSAKLRIFEKN